ncbi:hypothetical protein HK100_011950 [Physocladia obscura]|uniref:Response regulatory domain-containing protein n=1 Tax=Physocladia obscura TaxID=109957 RepID=A0AAD5XGS9_9FUNG|nr:hypothetical protein HK100_011950 [Physocladia obscura]
MSGSGLGMAVTKQIIELMGGSVKTFHENSGDCFVIFYIPVAIPSNTLQRGSAATHNANEETIVKSGSISSCTSQSCESNQSGRSAAQSIASYASRTVEQITTPTLKVSKKSWQQSVFAGLSPIEVSPKAQLSKYFTSAESLHAYTSYLDQIPEFLQGHILIVDDSPIFRQIFIRMLASLSDQIKVSQAENGMEAILICQKVAFGVIFMDLEMPIMAGEETSLKLKANGIQCPILAISSQNVMPEMLKNLKTSGISNFTPKPLSKDIVLRLLKQFNKPRNLISTMNRTADETIPEIPSFNIKLPQLSDENIEIDNSLSPPVSLAPQPSQPSPSRDVLQPVGLMLTTETVGRQKMSNSTLLPPQNDRYGSLHRNLTGRKVPDVGALQARSPTATSFLYFEKQLALVVDDSLINRSILVKMLNKLDYFQEIIEASNGSDAVRLCSQKKFAIVFMDLEMPGMSGEEAIARIRTQGITAPIIVVSGAHADEMSTLKHAGVTEILKKPVERAKIAEVCKTYTSWAPTQTSEIQREKIARSGGGVGAFSRVSIDTISDHSVASLNFLGKISKK